MRSGGAEGARAQSDAARCAPLSHLAMAAGFVAAVWALAASRWIATGTVVPWDSKNQFYAFFRFLASSLQAGESPFWNPYHYGGHPSVADPQSLIFAPAFVLWGWFDAEPSMRAFDLLVYAHLLAGALAVVAIGWRATWPEAACVLAALVFMLGGAASGRLQHTGIILSYALFPVALLLLQIALERRSILFGLGFAVVAAALALGRNQVALLLCFVLIAMAVREIVNAPARLRYLRERAVVFAVMGIAGFALIALPVLLTLQFAALSNRPDMLLADALKGSLHPANFATLVFANVFGSHDPNYWGPGWQMPEIQFTDQSFNYMFVGAVPVMLLLAIGLVGGRIWVPGRRVFAILLALSIVFMLGRYTPFFPLFFENLPGVSLFRRPVDGNFVFLIALSLLSGWLLADYMRAGLPRWNAPRALLVFAAVMAVIFSAYAVSREMGQGPASIAAMLLGMPAVILVATILVLAGAARTRTRAGAALTAIAAAQLLWWNPASHLNAESHATYAVLERPDPDDARALAPLEAALRERHARGEYPRVEIMGVGGPWQNLAMVRGYEATNGYNPLRIGLYDRLVAPGEATYAPGLRAFPKSFESYDCALARALGLDYVVLDRPIEAVPHLAKRPVTETLAAGPRLWIYRLKNTIPRVTFHTHVQVADAGAINASGQLINAPSAGRVLIDDDTPLARSYAVNAADTGEARVVSWQADRIEVETNARIAGVLALHATYYPGWIAEVDGSEVPLLRADILFRGVEVPAGRHRVVFRFAPFSMRNLENALALALRGKS